MMMNRVLLVEEQYSIKQMKKKPQITIDKPKERRRNKTKK